VRTLLRASGSMGAPYAKRLGRQGPSDGGSVAVVSGTEAERLVHEVRRALAAVADPEKAPAMQAYMKSSMPFLGIQARTMRSACKVVLDARPLADEHQWLEAVRLLWDDAGYREERYAAVELTGHRYYRGHQRPGTLALYRHLVTTGAWWDLVDTVAGNRVGPVLRAHPAGVTPVMRSWAVDEDLWVRRTAILCQLGSRAATDVELLGFVVERNLEDSLHGRDFFIRKAVGWALRQHARVDPGWVVTFVARHEEQLSGLSRREALKHLPD
jgi:3-methyladenine DNA glycosylase AlkD